MGNYIYFVCDSVYMCARVCVGLTCEHMCMQACVVRATVCVRVHLYVSVCVQNVGLQELVVDISTLIDGFLAFMDVRGHTHVHTHSSRACAHPLTHTQPRST